MLLAHAVWKSEWKNGMEIWYGNVQLEDVPRIVEETVIQGKILDDLLIDEKLLNTKGGRQLPDNG